MFHAEIEKVSAGCRPQMQRTRGKAEVGFKTDDGSTRLASLFQSGSAKIRIPKIYEGAPQAVLINTSGGVTGGDQLAYSAHCSEGTHAIVTSQTAERAYRASFETGRIDTCLSAENNSTIEWLPQETILFDGSALKRTLTADLTGDARLVALETVVIGRRAMGERVNHLHYQDRWRIKRDGKLTFADDIRLSGNPAQILSGPAAGEGAHCFASFIDCRPDAPLFLEAARKALQPALGLQGVQGAASAWKDVLTTRLISIDSQQLKKALTIFLETFRNCAVPRVWTC
ncbi:urease accessory protein [Roseibium hamelinense]|nr:urease accessory protein [Roseibium hamelinense]